MEEKELRGHHHEYECHAPHCTDPSHHHHHHKKAVSISRHEGSLIGAVKGVLSLSDYEEAEAVLARQMREAGRRITEAGGIIGHIKFLLNGPGRCGQISVTDTVESIRHFDGGFCQTEGVAIVFGVEEDVLETILNETVGSLLKKEN